MPQGPRQIFVVLPDKVLHCKHEKWEKIEQVGKKEYWLTCEECGQVGKIKLGRR